MWACMVPSENDHIPCLELFARDVSGNCLVTTVPSYTGMLVIEYVYAPLIHDMILALSLIQVVNKGRHLYHVESLALLYFCWY